MDINQAHKVQCIELTLTVNTNGWKGEPY